MPRQCSIFSLRPGQKPTGLMHVLVTVLAALCLITPDLASRAHGAVGGGDLSAPQTARAGKAPGKREQELSASLKGLSGIPFDNDMVDGANFIDKMLAAADSYHDYSFEFTMKVFKDRKTVSEAGVFYFKKPRLIRLEETGDYKRGAVAVLTANGKVQAHLGGGLKMFTVELDPNNNMLKSANGHPMIESDFFSLATALKQYLKQGVVSQITREAFDMKAEHDRVFVLEMRKAKDPSKIWKRVAVSARTHLPVQWWDYDDDGDLWSHANWSDFKPNQQLADSLFDIKRRDKNKAG